MSSPTTANQEQIENIQQLEAKLLVEKEHVQQCIRNMDNMEAELAKLRGEAAKLNPSIACKACGCVDKIVKPEPPLPPLPDGDGWIAWQGGEMPVSTETIVEVNHWHGKKSIGIAGGYSWQPECRGSDIKSYRLVPPPAPAFTVDKPGVYRRRDGSVVVIKGQYADGDFNGWGDFNERLYQSTGEHLYKEIPDLVAYLAPLPPNSAPLLNVKPGESLPIKCWCRLRDYDGREDIGWIRLDGSDFDFMARKDAIYAEYRESVKGSP